MSKKNRPSEEPRGKILPLHPDSTKKTSAPAKGKSVPSEGKPIFFTRQLKEFLLQSVRAIRKRENFSSETLHSKIFGNVDLDEDPSPTPEAFRKWLQPSAAHDLRTGYTHILKYVNRASIEAQDFDLEIAFHTAKRDFQADVLRDIFPFRDPEQVRYPVKHPMKDIAFSSIEGETVFFDDVISKSENFRLIARLGVYRGGVGRATIILLNGNEVCGVLSGISLINHFKDSARVSASRVAGFSVSNSLLLQGFVDGLHSEKFTVRSGDVISSRISIEGPIIFAPSLLCEGSSGDVSLVARGVGAEGIFFTLPLEEILSAFSQTDQLVTPSDIKEKHTHKPKRESKVYIAIRKCPQSEELEKFVNTFDVGYYYG